MKNVDKQEVATKNREIQFDYFIEITVKRLSKLQKQKRDAFIKIEMIAFNSLEKFVDL